MIRKSNSRRRKFFMLDSNQNKRYKPKKVLRNKVLNILSYFQFLNFFWRVFRASTIITFVMICMAGFILFALLSPYFTLKHIKIVRDNPNINVQAIDNTLKSFYGKNLLFLDKKLAITELKKQFPEFRKVTVKEIWPESVEIKVVLSPPHFTILNEADASFNVISDDGVVLLQKPDENLPLIKVKNYSKPLNAGDLFLTKSMIKKIDFIKNVFEQRFKVEIDELILLRVAKELHIKSTQGTVFWIDLSLEIEPQLQKLELATGRIQLYSNPPIHVDLRIPKQLFWKPR